MFNLTFHALSEHTMSPEAHTKHIKRVSWICGQLYSFIS